MAFFAKPRLLVIDELRSLPFEKRSAHLLFQLLARRYERGSLLITTNQTVTQWGSVFGDEVLAAAILDRLLHHSRSMTITGESYRLREENEAGLLGTATPQPTPTRAKEGGQDQRSDAPPRAKAWPSGRWRRTPRAPGLFQAFPMGPTRSPTCVARPPRRRAPSSARGGTGS